MIAPRTFVIPAVVCATVVLLAAIDMARGNPTAINAVIGAGLGTLVFTGLTWDAHRQRRR